MAKTVAFLDNRYELFILPEARQKMELYCDLSEGEIGWLAFVERFDKDGFLITDCALLEQEVHSTTTEITAEGLLKFWDSVPAERHETIKLWGHSHVNMSTSPSGQDDSQMEYFKDGNPWFIRLITNKKREYHIDIYDYQNGIKVHMDQADLKTYNPSANEMRKTIEAEIKEKVKQKTYTSLPATSSYKSNASSSRTVWSNSKKNQRKSVANPMLKDIDVKYVGNLDEVLSDPNYWQAILN
jgi:hypothetical protein